jgi:hypothetical protein
MFWSQFVQSESQVQGIYSQLETMSQATWAGSSFSNQKFLFNIIYSQKETLSHATVLEPVLPIRNSGESAFGASDNFGYATGWRKFFQSETPTQVYLQP